MSTPADHYGRIAQVIGYMRAHAARQPSLDELAGVAALSPDHFQRVFTEWAGVSPKKFLQYLTLGHAKALLAPRQVSLFDVADEVGLSGTGRLHDLFVTLQALTPGDYKAGGAGIELRYGLGSSRFGPYVAASTDRGLFALRFYDDNPAPILAEIQAELPAARSIQEPDEHQATLAALLNDRLPAGQRLALALKGTPFQVQVWEALLRIPEGEVSTYARLAAAIGRPSAARAVGSAVGANPVGWLIPCHRVIRAEGIFGDYRWGPTRKAAMLGWEAARSDAGCGMPDARGEVL